MQAEPNIERNQVERKGNEDPETRAPSGFSQPREVGDDGDDALDLEQTDEKLADASNNRCRRHALGRHRRHTTSPSALPP